ncbi:DHA2 family efflux MFS transporter permease subunit [Clostridium estertheticum]|uniref:DHA2 family efflux MFS transporter permease subunit n=1 Tax=Clostridium estertheticum TaxID=238834 RepID=UPI001C0D1685|nr:DHA2 family efflux MFS transporter permease subunit [Clostridium estertheticum]MBU3178360.1 DHA2 family efflux MFS transporter permease subunit [Clostridium estertheticum]
METKKSITNLNVKSIIAVLVFSGFISTFNETILNVALSSLMVEMNVTAGKIQWIITAYMIVVAVLVPVTAFLIQTFKTKKLFLVAMTILLVGTICAACSGSFVMLLISRILQAAGTGMIIPIMMNTVLAVTSPQNRGSVMGLCSAAITLGPAAGPTVAGIVLQSFTWHALFYILIPIIIVAVILGSIYLNIETQLAKPKIDFISIILSTIGFGGFIYGISGISEQGKNLKIVALIFIIGLISLILFVKRQLSLKEPMLDIRTFKYRAFSIGTLLVMISMMTVFTMAVMLPMFLQGALKKSTFIAAMVLLPATLISGFITPIGGKIYDKLGGKTLLPVGFAIILVPLFILSRSNVHTSVISIIILFIIVEIGIGVTLSPSQTTALSSLPKECYPHGIAIMNTLQQLAAAIGSSLFIGIMSASQLKALSNQATAQVASATGFSTATLALSGFVLIGFCLSIALRETKNKAKI